MLSKKDYQKLHHLITLAYFSVFILLIYLAFRYVFGLIAPFIIAFIAASLVEPIVKFLKSKLQISRALSSSVCIILLLALFGILLFFISSFILKEGKTILDNIPDYLKSLAVQIENKNGFLGNLPGDLSQSVLKFMAEFNYSSLFTGSVGSVLLKYAGNVVELLPNALLFIVVTLASSIFTSISFPKIKQFILIQFKQHQQSLILDIKKSFVNTIWKYIRSYSLLMLVTFTELLVFFLVFGFQSAFVLAVIIAFVDFLPVLGVGTALIPWAIFSLLTGEPWKALILICIYIVVTIVRQILEPKIIGDQVGMPPIITLFCIWIGLKLFGFLGMFIVPITVVILKDLQENKKIKLWNTLDSEGEANGT